MEKNNKYMALWNVMKREFRRLVSRPLYLFCMVVAPLFCYIFFTTLMDSGLPTDMPVGVVDQDMTTTSRQLVRNLDAFEQTAVVAHYPTIADARIAMQKADDPPAHRAVGHAHAGILHPRRDNRQSTSPAAAQNIFLYQQHVAHSRFITL